MIKPGFAFLMLMSLIVESGRAQHLYYKSPDVSQLAVFNDSAHRVFIKNVDSAAMLRRQFDYVLRFYPAMLVKNIIVEYRRSSAIVKTKPRFSSIFRAPSQRVYRVIFSRHTGSTLDSILIGNLSLNAQLGLIANQVSIIEDLSTGGFFNFIGWYVKSITHRGRARINKNAEEKTLEVGLGYQLLALNRECSEKLVIDNWTNTSGYANYIRNYKGRTMKPQMVLNFINDLPIYISQQYK